MKSCLTFMVAAMIALTRAAPDELSKFRGVWTIDHFYENELLIDKTPKVAPPMMEMMEEQTVLVEPPSAQAIAAALERDTMAIEVMAKTFTKNLIDIANSLTDTVDTTKSVDNLNIENILSQLPPAMLAPVSITPAESLFNVANDGYTPTFSVPSELLASIQGIYNPTKPEIKTPEMSRMARPFRYGQH